MSADICLTCDEREVENDGDLTCAVCTQKREDDGPSDSELAAYAESCYPTPADRRVAEWKMKG